MSQVLRNGFSLEELRLTGTTEMSSVLLAVDEIILTIQQCLEFHEEETYVSKVVNYDLIAFFLSIFGAPMERFKYS